MKALMIKGSGLLTIFLFGVLLFNLSFTSGVPDQELKILSHRGVHQTFHRDGLTNETCTATRIHAPTHSFIENTIPSIQAAFDYGADMVEIDVQRTADGQFAVFHDAGLECRTNGVGKVSDHRMDALRELDVGFGYTADGGNTYPLRGEGLGLMVSLDEVLKAFPDKALQINAKSNSAKDADRLLAYLTNEGLVLNDQIFMWAGQRFASRWREINSSTPIGSRPDIKACAKSYLAWGWNGRVPSICSTYGLVIPQNLTWAAWGWPRKTVTRFRDADIPVFLVGPLDSDYEGIETLDQIRAIPSDYRGWVITNRIEVVGPEIKSISNSPIQ